jgi:hypothetical protein
MFANKKHSSLFSKAFITQIKLYSKWHESTQILNKETLVITLKSYQIRPSLVSFQPKQLFKTIFSKSGSAFTTHDFLRNL